MRSFWLRCREPALAPALAPAVLWRRHVSGTAAANNRRYQNDQSPPVAATEEPVLHVVLFNPQIPPNTGAIGRSCLATRCRLHLIRPLGFSLDDKTLKRAGLDYWQQVDCVEHDSWEEYLINARPRRIYLFTTKATKPHWSVKYERGDHLLFGSESSGVPKSVHDHVGGEEGTHGQRVCLPIAPEVEGRSLNLASTAMTAIYEGLRSVSLDEGSLPWSS